MAEKRYYWLKLKRDFFKRHDIQIIEAMPNGKDYVLFYLKMLVESIDHEGELRFSDTIPYNEQMLSVITNTNIDIVRSAMKLFRELNMVEILDDQTIFMQEVQAMLAGESSSAARVRKHREKAKALQCNADETKSNTDIEIEKEIDTDIEKEGEKKTRAKRFAPPTLEEVAAYCRERGNSVSPERFIDYYTSNGWKVGRNPMKDWKAAVRNWEKDEKPKAQGKDTGFETNNPFLEMLEERSAAHEL